MTVSRPSILALCAVLIGLGLAGIAIFAAAASIQDSPSKTESRTPMNDREDANASKVFSTSGHDVTPLSKEAIGTLAKALDPEAFRVTQRAGTEPAFCGNLLDNKKDGFYACTVCGLPLFKSDHKFASGTGWPSFFQPFDSAHVGQETDTTGGMIRTEIRCNRCAAHLGHVFPDGPPPTNMRYCLNGAALKFFEDGEPVPAQSRPALETAYFAGGCFWGVEHAFQQVPGVVDATSGYQQGDVDHPTYKQVCSKNSGHAESVRVLFDPMTVDFETLVKFFFIVHDATQVNRQGVDFGPQYRSGIYTTSDAQAKTAHAILKAAGNTDYQGQTIVTEIQPARAFWPAESYHQNYVFNTGRGCNVNIPAALEAIGIGPRQDKTKNKPVRP
jgi:peptide methionine sulfoxide reductase msrA/msrB